MNSLTHRAVKAFTLKPFSRIEHFGSGHINHTYLIHFNDGLKAILQEINTSVFKTPTEVMNNLLAISTHLKAHLKTQEALRWWVIEGQAYVIIDDHYFRICDYIENTITYQTAPSLEHIHSMGIALAQFHIALSDFPVSSLAHTIPHFHDTPHRITLFEAAVKGASSERLLIANEIVSELNLRRNRAILIRQLMKDGKVPLRVTHNDTKVNNFLFDNNSIRVKAIVDWDTLMAGSWLDDIGDALRSLSNSAREDETNLALIHCDTEVVYTFLSGYLSEAAKWLTLQEKEHLLDALWTITFELAMRFLTDYLQGDSYFRIERPLHNFERARAQLTLLQSIETQDAEMANKITDLLLSFS